jgi:hypothetical protein
VTVRADELALLNLEEGSSLASPTNEVADLVDLLDSGKVIEGHGPRGGIVGRSPCRDDS